MKKKAVFLHLLSDLLIIMASCSSSESNADQHKEKSSSTSHDIAAVERISARLTSQNSNADANYTLD